MIRLNGMSIMTRWNNEKCCVAIITLNENLDKIEDGFDEREIWKLFSVKPPLYSKTQATKIEALWEKYANGEPESN